jgi:hypothetical protein
VCALSYLPNVNLKIATYRVQNLNSWNLLKLLQYRFKHDSTPLFESGMAKNTNCFFVFIVYSETNTKLLHVMTFGSTL